MEIKQLDKKAYEGKNFIVQYKTNGYYDIFSTENGFKITHAAFATTQEKSFNDVFFGDWLENPVAFGAFENEDMIGYAEGSLESWNNRFRISNICLFDDSNRGKGIGRMLMETILKYVASLNVRMIVLETQSCNENAVAFYKKMGFDIIGFDLYAYSNEDPEQHEIRIEMGKKLK